MTWAQRLKRVFNIDVKICRVCGGAESGCCFIVTMSAIEVAAVEQGDPVAGWRCGDIATLGLRRRALDWRRGFAASLQEQVE